AERVQGGGEPAGLDLRHHAGREVGLLRQLPLLQVSLEPQRLDPRAQRRHRTTSSRYRSTSTMTSRPWTATATWIEPPDAGAFRTTPAKFTKGPSRTSGDDLHRRSGLQAGQPRQRPRHVHANEALSVRMREV